MCSCETVPESLRGKVAVDVETAGRALGLSRASAYSAVRTGELPSVRLGRRVLVPVPKLLELFGVVLADAHAA